MQATKDSFYRAVQSRLAAVNPARTITLDGQTRPAVLVAENAPFPPPKLFFNTFYIHWLGARPVPAFRRTPAPRYELLAQVEFFVQGTPSLLRPHADRGRVMAEMDCELVEILFPGLTPKLDYSSDPPAPLGSEIVWQWTPELRLVLEGEGSVLRRIATLRISAFLETIPD
jgi:hypothetical protein